STPRPCSRGPLWERSVRTKRSLISAFQRRSTCTPTMGRGSSHLRTTPSCQDTLPGGRTPVPKTVRCSSSRHLTIRYTPSFAAGAAVRELFPDKPGHVLTTPHRRDSPMHG